MEPYDAFQAAVSALLSSKCTTKFCDEVKKWFRTWRGVKVPVAAARDGWHARVYRMPLGVIHNACLHFQTPWSSMLFTCIVVSGFALSDPAARVLYAPGPTHWAHMY